VADPSSSSEAPFGGRAWRAFRTLLLGRDPDASLRDQIEEAIEEHAGDAEGSDDMSETERTILRNLLDFGNARVDDVMVPRADMIAFEASASFRALVALFREAGHSRVPVFEEDLDHVVGMIHLKDVYAHLADTGIDTEVSAKDLMRTVLFVPASMGVLDLLARMRVARTHMAIVIDEFGGTDGLVTIEDLLEAIVGDIEDEHDEAEEGLKALGDDLYEADARLDIEELEAALGQPFADPDDDVDTLGGMVALLAGRVPAEGETIAHANGWRFEVIEADPRRIARVRIHPPEALSAQDAAE
jgi:CBS domain containing-hemolysin-like protein